MNTQLEAVTQKEVTRKEFLMTVGFGLLSVMGIGTLVKLFSGHHSPTAHTSSSAEGYGVSSYGGR